MTVNCVSRVCHCSLLMKECTCNKNEKMTHTLISQKYFSTSKNNVFRAKHKKDWKKNRKQKQNKARSIFCFAARKCALALPYLLRSRSSFLFLFSFLVFLFLINFLFSSFFVFVRVLWIYNIVAPTVPDSQPSESPTVIIVQSASIVMRGVSHCRDLLR